MDITPFTDWFNQQGFRHFNALDITFAGVGPVRVHAVLKSWRNQGRFTGGLGLYRNSGFVHIDTRGDNATWEGA